MSNCKRCGKCCNDLIIEIGEHDILREPRLLEHVRLLDGNGEMQYDSYEEKLDRVYMLETPCPFFVDDECTIYPTRPNVCVGFESCGDQCKALNEGIPLESITQE